MRIWCQLSVCMLLWSVLGGQASTAEIDRPNILWITSEDNGPQLGCYGDDYAVTPNIDRLASHGLRYLNAWSNAPVCAPARTALISGLYPPSTGSEHMRSMVSLPDGFRMYPQYLRDAGYYCTNNSKEDYNLKKPGKVWDDSSGKAHWKNRKEGQPFFAIFNIGVSHESQLRKRPHKLVHDPAKAPIPDYHPDTPEVRHDWAQYYDKLTEMDSQVGRRLKELTDAGLAEDTIIFYYGDHGSGMPRSKRWPYNSGLHVPLIVVIPPKYQSLASPEYMVGDSTDRLVSFVDLGPTVLSLAGVKPPEHFQGQAFLGKYQQEPQDHLFGFRGRMDERYDLVRCVRDKRYIYIRHFMPQKLYGQHVDYMFQTPTTRVWKRLFDEGKLNEAQSHFWKTKPAEELYDLQEDPDEVNNLADDPAYVDVKERLNGALKKWIFTIRDVGFLPENQIHSRSEGRTPFEVGHDESAYPIYEIVETASLASTSGSGIEKIASRLNHSDPACRYWAALGAIMRGKDTVTKVDDKLRALLNDEAPSVRVVAAEALAKFGQPSDADAALKLLVKHADLRENTVYIAMLACNALDELDDKATSVRDQIADLPRNDKSLNRRMRSYVDRLLDKTLSDLKTEN